MARGRAERLGAFSNWINGHPDKCEYCVWRDQDADGPLLGAFEPCNMWLQFRHESVEHETTHRSIHNQRHVQVISMVVGSHGVRLPDMLKQTHMLDITARAARKQHLYLDVSKFRDDTVQAPFLSWVNAKFDFQNELAGEALLYSCNQLNLHCRVQKIGQPPVLTINVKASEEHIAVAVTMMSGKNVVDCEYPKTSIPTYAAIRNKATSHLLQENLISAQQTIRLVLCSGAEPIPRAKVWKKRSRGD